MTYEVVSHATSGIHAFIVVNVFRLGLFLANMLVPVEDRSCLTSLDYYEKIAFLAAINI